MMYKISVLVYNLYINHGDTNDKFRLLNSRLRPA